jgi:hypothetical protein
LAPFPPSGIVDRVSTPDLPPPPDNEDLRGLARGLRLLFEIAAQTLAEDAGFRPHENLLSLISSPQSGGFMMGGPVRGSAAFRAAGTRAASFGTARRSCATPTSPPC